MGKRKPLQITKKEKEKTKKRINLHSTNFPKIEKPQIALTSMY